MPINMTDEQIKQTLSEVQKRYYDADTEVTVGVLAVATEAQKAELAYIERRLTELQQEWNTAHAMRIIFEELRQQLERGE